MKEWKILCKAPWDDKKYLSPSLAASFLNKNPEKYHLMRMTGLILQEAYKKYPDTNNNRLEKLIEEIKDIESYKEITSKATTRLVSSSTSSRPSERPPFRSH